MTATVDLKAEQRKVLVRGGAAVAVGMGMLLAAYFLLPRYWAFPSEPAERLVFVLQADVFIFVWVVIGIQRVSSGRYRSAVDNRGSGFGAPSPAIALKVAFLQNTLEQAFIAVGAHLALAAATGGPLLALISASVALFAIGRIAFLIGYPHGAGGRAFGIVLTMLPSYVLYATAVWLIVSRLIG